MFFFSLFKYVKKRKCPHNKPTKPQKKRRSTTFTVACETDAAFENNLTDVVSSNNDIVMVSPNVFTGVDSHIKPNQQIKINSSIQVN